MKPQPTARERLRYSPRVPSVGGAILALMLSTGQAWAQTLPPGAERASTWVAKRRRLGFELEIDITGTLV